MAIVDQTPFDNCFYTNADIQNMIAEINACFVSIGGGGGDPVLSVVANGDNRNVNVTNQTAGLSSVDFLPIVQNLETDTTLTFLNNQLTFLNEAGTPFVASVAHTFSSPTPGTIRLTRPDGTFDEEIIPLGETNTVSNIGAGANVFESKLGLDFRLRSIVGGNNITAVQNANDITINNDLNNLIYNYDAIANIVRITDNLGNTTNIPQSNASLVDNGNNSFSFTPTGGGAVVNFGVGHNLSQPVAGTIRLTRPDGTFDDEIIAAGGGGGEINTSSNAGTGLPLALPKAGVDLPFKSLTEGANIVLTDNGTDISIANALSNIVIAYDNVNHEIDITDNLGNALAPLDLNVSTLVDTGINYGSGANMLLHRDELGTPLNYAEGFRTVKQAADCADTGVGTDFTVENVEIDAAGQLILTQTPKILHRGRQAGFSGAMNLNVTTPGTYLSGEGFMNIDNPSLCQGLRGRVIVDCEFSFTAGNNWIGDLEVQASTDGGATWLPQEIRAWADGRRWGGSLINIGFTRRLLVAGGATLSYGLRFQFVSGGGGGGVGMTIIRWEGFATFMGWTEQ